MTVMMEEKTYHDKQESSNMDAKNSKKEEYNTDDIANIAGVEEKQREMQSDLKVLAEALEIEKSTHIQQNEEKIKNL